MLPLVFITCKCQFRKPEACQHLSSIVHLIDRHKPPPWIFLDDHHSDVNRVLQAPWICCLLLNWKMNNRNIHHHKHTHLFDARGKNCRKAGGGVYIGYRVSAHLIHSSKFSPKKTFHATLSVFYMFYVSTLFIFHVLYPKLFVAPYPINYV